MKPVHLLTSFLLLLLPFFCLGQISDSSSIAANAPAYVQDDEFNIFLIFFGLAIISFSIGVAIIGAGLAVFLLTLAAALIGTGVLSVAIVVGLIKKSLSATLKTLLYLTCSLIGAVAGIFGFWTMAMVFHLQLNSVSGLLGGLLAGVLGGLLWARMSVFILGKAKKYFEDLLVADGTK
jgi:hypothetical protein